MWKLRGNLPHAVEATALLTDARLHDDRFTGTKKTGRKPRIAKNSAFSIQATYSAAFCRFVTGLVDSRMHDRRMTMYRRAAALGLPASFVELRHEATHRELPSLLVFRDAAVRALEWLWGFYWADLPLALARDGSNADGGGRWWMVGGDWPPPVDAEGVWKQLQAIATEAVSGSWRPKQEDPEKWRTSPEVQKLAVLCRNRVEAVSVVSQVLTERCLLTPSSKKARTKNKDTANDDLDFVQSLSTWDSALQGLCRRCEPLLTLLCEGLVSHALFADNGGGGGADAVDGPALDSKDPETAAMAVSWLEHIMTAQSWARVREIYLSSAYAQELCRSSDKPSARRILAILDGSESTNGVTGDMMDIEPSDAGR